MCFERAQDRPRETFARAKVHEEDGRICSAQANHEGAQRNFETAVRLFMELNLVGEASKILVKMGDFERAAGKHNLTQDMVFFWLTPRGRIVGSETRVW